jgi:hypothetical protein
VQVTRRVKIRACFGERGEEDLDRCAHFILPPLSVVSPARAPRAALLTIQPRWRHASRSIHWRSSPSRSADGVRARARLWRGCLGVA